MNNIGGGFMPQMNGMNNNPFGQMFQLVMGLLMGMLTGGLMGGLMDPRNGGAFAPGMNPGFGGPGGCGCPGSGGLGNNLGSFLGGPGGNFGGPGGNYGGPGGNYGAPNANPNTQIPNYGPNASKQQIGQMLDAAAAKYGIPPNILKAVAYQESGWRTNARSFDGGHGKGVMQIDDRFHQFARTNAVFDPAQNIDYGAKFLRSLYDKTGSWEAALKRYNGGSSYPPKIMSLAQRQPWRQWG